MRFFRQDPTNAIACPRCKFRTEEAGIALCPLCGSPVVPDSVEENDSCIRISIRFRVWECDKCGELSKQGGEPTCLHCGADLDGAEAGDANIDNRILAYGPGIKRLEERAQYLAVPRFSTRGARMPLPTYLRWLSAELYRPFSGYAARLDGLMNATQWDDPKDPLTLASWPQVQATCHDSLDRIERASSAVPPTLLLAFHRQTVRALARAAQAFITMVSVLTAPDVDAAVSRAAAFEEATGIVGDQVVKHSEAVQALSPFLVGVVRLSSLNYNSLPESSELFPELNGWSKQDPAMLVPLEGVRILASFGQDEHRRMIRHQEALRLLAAASGNGSSWISDKAAFLATAQRGWSQLVAQCRRIVNELDHADPVLRMHGMLDSFSKLAEGPFRGYGAALVVANKVAQGRSQRLDQEELFKVRGLNAVYKELSTCLPAVTIGLDRALRNAEAHYDYEVFGQTVRINHLPPGAGSPAEAVTDELLHDDVVDQTLDLFEATLAMALALAVFAWDCRDIELREMFRSQWLSFQSN